MQPIEVSTSTIKVKIGDTELVLSQEEATALRDAITATLPKPAIQYVPTQPHVYGPLHREPNPFDQYREMQQPWVAPYNRDIAVTCQN